MTAFRFGLDGLLKLRQHQQDAARQDLAESGRTVRDATEQLNAIDDEKKQVAEAVGRDSNLATVSSLAAGHARYHLLGTLETASRRQLDAATEQHEEHREAAVAAQRELKTVQRLHEKALYQHLRHLRRLEDRDLDETATLRAGREVGLYASRDHKR